jgi:hypothetical protein
MPSENPGNPGSDNKNRQIPIRIPAYIALVSLGTISLDILTALKCW